MRILFLLFLSFPAVGQDTCGTWQPVINIESWADSGANWVYDEWRVESVNGYRLLPDCPCGCPENTIETQSRIDSVTGDIEIITRRTEYMYIRRAKSDFEMTLERFE